MNKKFFIALVILIATLNGCGNKRKKMETTKANTGELEASLGGKSPARVSFFDEDLEEFEEAETLVLDEDNQPEQQGVHQTLAWQDSVSTPATHIHSVYFEYDSTELRNDQEANLQEVKTTVKEWVNQGHKVAFKGHACMYHGTSDYNIALSDQRARQLAGVVGHELDIPQTMIQCFGVGSNEPLVLSDSKEGNSPNRRVEVYPLPLTA